MATKFPTATGVWQRRLGVPRLVRTKLLVTLLVATYIVVFLYTHTHPHTSSTTPTPTRLHTRHTSQPPGHAAEPSAPTQVLLLQATELPSVRDVAPPALLRQPSPTPPQQEFPFRYLINEPDICHRDVTILNMIPLAPNRLSSRLMIRDVWGNQQFTVLTKMRTVFVLGATSSGHHQRHLEAESHKYHDIIQLNFTDSYLNLTLKTLAILHWTQTFCQGAKWILKSDDDVFVNPFALTNFLQDHQNVNFVCRMNKNLKVCRTGQRCPQKWAVSHEEYAEDYYPPYCDGPAYVVSTRMARRIYAAANKTHPHQMEDAYFTGVVARVFQPKYRNLHRRRFPRRTSHFLPSFWNGFALFLEKLEKKKGASYTLWNKILHHNNISTASPQINLGVMKDMQ